jgi:hypothetical protein
VPEGTKAKAIREASGAQAGELSVPPPLLHNSDVSDPSASVTYSAYIENLLGPPTKAMRPSGAQVASRT